MESIGYDVGIVFVDTPLEVAIKRAADRAEKTGRVVDEAFIRAVDSRNKENASYLKEKVDFFRRVENHSNELGDEQMALAFKHTQQFFASEIRNPIGTRTLQKLRDSKQKYLAPLIISRAVLDAKVNGWYKL